MLGDHDRIVHHHPRQGAGDPALRRVYHAHVDAFVPLGGACNPEGCARLARQRHARPAHAPDPLVGCPTLRTDHHRQLQWQSRVYNRQRPRLAHHAQRLLHPHFAHVAHHPLPVVAHHHVVLARLRGKQRRQHQTRPHRPADLRSVKAPLVAHHPVARCRAHAGIQLHLRTRLHRQRRRQRRHHQRRGHAQRRLRPRCAVAVGHLKRVFPDLRRPHRKQRQRRPGPVRKRLPLEEPAVLQRPARRLHHRRKRDGLAGPRQQVDQTTDHRRLQHLEHGRARGDLALLYPARVRRDLEVVHPGVGVLHVFEYERLGAGSREGRTVGQRHAVTAPLVFQRHAQLRLDHTGVGQRQAAPALGAHVARRHRRRTKRAAACGRRQTGRRYFGFKDFEHFNLPHPRLGAARLTVLVGRHHPVVTGLRRGPKPLEHQVRARLGKLHTDGASRGVQ